MIENHVRIIEKISSSLMLRITLEEPHHSWAHGRFPIILLNYQQFGTARGNRCARITLKWYLKHKGHSHHSDLSLSSKVLRLGGNMPYQGPLTAFPDELTVV